MNAKLDKETTNRIEKISIKARVALGVSLLEEYAKILEVFENPRIQRLIDTIWEICTSIMRWTKAEKYISQNRTR